MKGELESSVMRNMGNKGRDRWKQAKKQAEEGLSKMLQDEGVTISIMQ